MKRLYKEDLEPSMLENDEIVQVFSKILEDVKPNKDDKIFLDFVSSSLTNMRKDNLIWIFMKELE